LFSNVGNFSIARSRQLDVRVVGSDGVVHKRKFRLEQIRKNLSEVLGIIFAEFFTAVMTMNTS
jgi:hypothetical protein